MTDVQIVKVDDGGVNARILAKEVKPDFRRIEAPGLKMRARFTSAEGKRFFVRLFNTQQLNAHFISVIARTRLEHGDVEKVEATLRAQVDGVTEKLNHAIDSAEALFKANGITTVATYDTVPLEVEVSVLSSSGRRYLELLGKLDQLMPLLQTLEIHDVLSPQDVDIQRAALKRLVRDVANGTRNFATGLRRRMNALVSREVSSAGNGESVPASDAESLVPETDLPDGAGDVVEGSSGLQGVEAITLGTEVIEPA